jgi:hypothetical protein
MTGSTIRLYIQQTGKVEAAFSDSFIVKLENEENNMEIKYQIPRLEISSLNLTEVLSS